MLTDALAEPAASTMAAASVIKEIKVRFMGLSLLVFQSVSAPVCRPNQFHPDLLLLAPPMDPFFERQHGSIDGSEIRND
jgi:hypothetical protein